MARKYWEDQYEYKRILELLSVYWLEEEDEEYVEVEMYFKHKKGLEQWKHIIWRNPNHEDV